MPTGSLRQDARLYVRFANKRIAIGHRDDFIKYHHVYEYVLLKTYRV